VTRQPTRPGSTWSSPEATRRYRALARFDDELAIAVSLAHLGTTSMVAAITVDRDAIRVAEGKTRHG
jgi:acyl-CoA thioester hydrolase